MQQMEQILDGVRLEWESMWTPFSDEEWGDLCGMMAAKVRESCTIQLRHGWVIGQALPVGDVIRKARLIMGVTQLNLATAIGVSCSTVCGWENSRMKPLRRNVLALRAVLGQSIPLPPL